jgi:hypothetical protein
MNRVHYGVNSLDLCMNFGSFLTANMTYAISKNYTIMVVGKLGIHTFKVIMIVVLLLLMLPFDVDVPTSASLILFRQVVTRMLVVHIVISSFTSQS